MNLQRTLLLFIVFCGATRAATRATRAATRDTRATSCGTRANLPFNNATHSSLFDVETFRTFPQLFPWVQKLSLVQNSRHLLLCTGAAVSPFVAIFPAHCVSGNEKTKLRVGHFPVENVIVHPNFIFKHPSYEHDLALVKIRSFSGFKDMACLPEFDEDPVEDCQVANFFPDKSQDEKYSLLSYWLSFGPSEACMETPHLRGYINSSSTILCSQEDKCQTFVQVNLL